MYVRNVVDEDILEPFHLSVVSDTFNAELQTLLHVNEFFGRNSKQLIGLGENLISDSAVPHLHNEINRKETELVCITSDVLEACVQWLSKEWAAEMSNVSVIKLMCQIL